MIQGHVPKWILFSAKGSACSKSKFNVLLEHVRNDNKSIFISYQRKVEFLTGPNFLVAKYSVSFRLHGKHYFIFLAPGIVTRGAFFTNIVIIGVFSLILLALQ